jgi:hypothetical protein
MANRKGRKKDVWTDPVVKGRGGETRERIVQEKEDTLSTRHFPSYEH